MALDTLLPPPKAKQHEQAIEAALKERGLATVVFWKHDVFGLIKRIGYNILDVDYSLQKLTVEKAVERIEALLLGEEPPKEAKPMRSADEVISASVRDQGRLDQSTGVVPTKAADPEESGSTIPEATTGVTCKKCGTPKTGRTNPCPKCNPNGAKHRAEALKIAAKRDKKIDARRAEERTKPKPTERPMPTLHPAIAAIAPPAATEPESLYELVGELARIDAMRDTIKRKIVTACGGVMPELQNQIVATPPPLIAEKVATPMGVSKRKIFKCSKCGHGKPGASSKCKNCNPN